jgi:hypothetical protein
VQQARHADPAAGQLVDTGKSQTTHTCRSKAEDTAIDRLHRACWAQFDDWC